MVTVKAHFLIFFLSLFCLADAAGAERHKILVVDDEEGPREAVGETIGELFPGTTIVLAQGRAEGRAEIEKDPKHFGLVVSDLEMGESTGLQLAEDVRKTDPAIPFILVSARVPIDEGRRREMLAEVKRFGVSAVVPKTAAKMLRETVITISLGAGGLLGQIAATGPVHQILLVDADANLGSQHQAAIGELIPLVNVVRVGTAIEAFALVQRHPRVFRLIVVNGRPGTEMTEIELAGHVQSLDERATFVLLQTQVPTPDLQRQLRRHGVTEVVKAGDLPALQQTLRLTISGSGCGFFISRLPQGKS